MFDLCIQCGTYAPEDGFELVDGAYLCPSCGHRHPLAKWPLLVVVGAPGAGKSSLCNQALLAADKPDIVFLAADYLAVLEANGSRASLINHLVLLAAVTAQSGRPVVLFCGGDPGEFEQSTQRHLIPEIHYLAVVCKREILRQRHWARPQWRKAGYSNTAELEQAIEGWCDWNQRLIDRADPANPPYELLDTSAQSREACLAQLFYWIGGKMEAFV